jgi:hypothetical protein
MPELALYFLPYEEYNTNEVNRAVSWGGRKAERKIPTLGT